jgi:hypothetical protein
VISLIPRCAAACLLRSPLTTRGKTSRSRGVNESKSLQTVQVGLLGAALAILSEGSMHQPQHLPLAEELCQKIERSRFDGAYAGWDVSVPHERDNRRMISASNLLPQVQAINIRELKIQDKARGYVRLGEGNLFGSLSECHSMNLRGGQQIHKCLAHSMVVVHD